MDCRQKRRCLESSWRKLSSASWSLQTNSKGSLKSINWVKICPQKYCAFDEEEVDLPRRESQEQQVRAESQLVDNSQFLHEGPELSPAAELLQLFPGQVDSVS